MVQSGELTEAKFLQAYGDFLVQYWGLPSHQERFKRDPKGVLKEFGLDTGSSKLNVKFINPANMATANPNNLGIVTPSAHSAFLLWSEGKKKGEIDFFVPEEPPEQSGSTELSDQELMSVAGGGWRIRCCSCCPCCSR